MNKGRRIPPLGGVCWCCAHIPCKSTRHRYTMDDIGSTAATVDDNEGEHQTDVETVTQNNLELSICSPHYNPPTIEPVLSIHTLLTGMLPDSDNEIHNDPNFVDFIKFHNKVNSLFPTKTDPLAHPEKPIPLSDIPKYNWDILSYTFEYVYRLYREEISSILTEFDNLDIKRSIWQESAFRIDAERASKKFKKLETWISNQDSYLHASSKDLSTGVQNIRDTLAKLDQLSSHIANSSTL